MANLIGKPQSLKQVNLSVIRKAIKEKGLATRSEIAFATKLSVTTVRALLNEMLENQEITDAGCGESIGGRKAVRYELNKDRFSGAAFCLDKENIHYLIVNICGEIQGSGTFLMQEDASSSICAFLDKLTARIEIRSIGIGVPGVVHGLSYQKKNPAGGLDHHPIGEVIQKRYGIPVVLENDLNAVTLGFGRCYLNQFPEEKCENVNMAYIHFGEHCLSAGFLSNGQILRGWNNFVGELGLFPVNETMTLDELLSSTPDDKKYADLVAKLLAAVCCILNPQSIALGGSAFKKDLLPLIMECYNSTLPDKMSAEILYAEDKWHDYFEGMAYLTAEQIFADTLLIRG